MLKAIGRSPSKPMKIVEEIHIDGKFNPEALIRKSVEKSYNKAVVKTEITKFEKCIESQ